MSEAADESAAPQGIGAYRAYKWTSSLQAAAYLLGMKPATAPAVNVLSIMREEFQAWVHRPTEFLHTSPPSMGVTC